MHFTYFPLQHKFVCVWWERDCLPSLPLLKKYHHVHHSECLLYPIIKIILTKSQHKHYMKNHHEKHSDKLHNIPKSHCSKKLLSYIHLQDDRLLLKCNFSIRMTSNIKYTIYDVWLWLWIFHEVLEKLYCEHTDFILYMVKVL